MISHDHTGHSVGGHVISHDHTGQSVGGHVMSHDSHELTSCVLTL